MRGAIWAFALAAMACAEDVAGEANRRLNGIDHFHGYGEAEGGMPGVGFDMNSDLCRTCRCAGTSVDCSSRGLTEVPMGMPAGITELYLTDNDITMAVDDAVFSDLTTLEILYMDAITVNLVATGVLAKITTLHHAFSCAENGCAPIQIAGESHDDGIHTH